MKIWLDAHLPPQLAPWLQAEAGVQCTPVRDLDLRHAKDPEIFRAAREADVVVMTKDRDFVDLLERLGPPPRVIWLTLGNTSNRHLRTVLQDVLPEVLDALIRGEPLVEITGT